MSFETPAALWGLLSVALLLLLSLWRQGSERKDVPSLLLWKAIPERNPPVRALRRPRWNWATVLQAAALAAAVAALAGPFAETQVPLPRKIALVFDTSARMLADGRIDLAREEARRFTAQLRPQDRTVVYACMPDPRRGLSLDEVRAVHAHVDVAPLLAAARQEADEVILFSDRAPEGVRAALFGGRGGNIGIVEFRADDGEIFARIVNHGGSRRVPLRVTLDGVAADEMLDVAEGVSAWSRTGDFRSVHSVEVRLETGDHFALDDAAGASRIVASRMWVSVTGRHHPQLVKALEAVPGVKVVRGVGPALAAVGMDELPGPAPVRVWWRTPEEPFVPVSFTIREGDPLTAGLRGREREMGRVPMGALQAPANAELLFVAEDGKIAGAAWGGIVHLSIDPAPGGWPATPSFPIFWTNVVDCARRNSGSLVAARSGCPLDLPAGTASVTPREPGAVWRLSPEGRFVAYTLGAYEVPEGGKVRVNLLDSRESDTAGEARALGASPEVPAGSARERRPFAGHAAALALVLVIAAWVFERRGE